MLQIKIEEKILFLKMLFYWIIILYISQKLITSYLENSYTVWKLK